MKSKSYALVVMVLAGVLLAGCGNSGNKAPLPTVAAADPQIQSLKADKQKAEDKVKGLEADNKTAKEKMADLESQKASLEASNKVLNKSLAYCNKTRVTATRVPKKVGKSSNLEARVSHLEASLGQRNYHEEIRGILSARTGVKAAASASSSSSTATAIATTVSPAADGVIWLWHHHKATASKPGACIIDSGDGEGLPPYCAGFAVKARLANETKAAWLSRVGGGGRVEDTGLYQKAGLMEH